jgi:radical SAM superfamily enzyme YgiQ (UPF0313 family)
MKNPELTLILVMPPQFGLLGGFATGLISLANYVRANQANVPKIEVQLLDLSSTPLSSLQEVIRQSQISGRISFSSQTVVGVTTTTASYQAALATASAFKSLSIPGVEFTTVFGGPHASADAEIVLERNQGTVDYVVVGEGEIVMTEFLHRFPRVCSTPGLAFWHNVSVNFNPPPALLNESQLDSIPLTFEGDSISGTPGKFGHVTYVSARGCPLKCAFCSVSNQKIRARSVARVCKDIRQLVELGFSRIAIEDNFFAHTPRRTDELCGALAELRRGGLEFSWDCQTRVESMDREGLVPLLERAGAEAVYLGVESLVPRHLEYLNKAPNPERYLERLNRKVVPALLESNVSCYINLQFGLPGETDEDHTETKKILKKMGKAAADHGKTITIFPQLHVVYPGTSHFDFGWRRDKIFPRDIFESFTKWEAKQAPVLKWLGKHFAHGTGGIPIGILKPKVLEASQFETDDGGAEKIVDVDAVMRISSVLTDLDEFAGIKIFKYGKYLVNESGQTQADGRISAKHFCQKQRGADFLTITSAGRN